MIRAAVMSGKEQRIVVKLFSKPNMELGSILLETIYSEVCGTDCHLHHGRLLEVPYPIIPGHISVGRITEKYGDIRDINGNIFKVGDIVTFWDVINTCGNCWHCLVAKAETKCPSRKVYGVTTCCKDGLLGGWAEYIYIKPNTKLLRLPENITPETFIAGGCGMPTGFHAIERAEIKMNDTVVIQGSGPVGLNAAIFALLSGAGKVVMIGAPDLRLNYAKRLGVDEVINIETTTLSERIDKIKSITKNIGADVVIEACGNPNAIGEGLKIVRDYGVYVIVGQYTDNGNIEINPHLDINKKHTSIRGCWGLHYSHMYKSIEMMSKYQDRFDWCGMISGYYGLNGVENAIHDVETLKVIKAVINPKL